MKTLAIIKRAAMLGLMVSAAVFNVMAVDYYWDAAPDGTGPHDGGGDWNLTNANWWNGAANVVFDPDAAGSTITIGSGGAGNGAGATINVSGAIVNSSQRVNFSKITINNTADGGNYTLAGSGQINLDGKLLELNASGTTVISNPFAVSDVTFKQAGTLLLTNGATSGGAPFFAWGGGQLAAMRGDTAAISRASTLVFQNSTWANNLSNVKFNLGDVTAETGGTVVDNARINIQGSNQGNVNAGFVVGWNQNGGNVTDNANGLLVIKNSGTLWSTNDNAIRIASQRDATGKLILESGLLSAAADIYVGFDYNAVGVLDVRGGVLETNRGLSDLAKGNLIVNYKSFSTMDGITGSGVLTVSGGTIVTNGILFGGEKNNTEYKTVANGVTAAFRQSGGIVYVGANGINVGGTGAASYANLKPEVTLSGGTLAAYASWSSTLKMNLSGGVTTFQTTNANFEGKSITLDNELSGAGALAKTGAGTLFLNAANSYEGGTTVSEGVLSVGAAGILGTGGVFVDGGATLTLGNHLAIDSVASLTFADGATINLNFSDPGDTLTLSGVFLDGGLSLAANTYSVTQLNQFFNLSGDIFFGTGNITVIPEPSTWTLLLTGAALLAVLRRRK